MWPFTRRAKDVKSLPSLTSDDQQWGVAQANLESGPLLIRFNSSAKEWVGHKALAIKLGFAVPLNEPNEGGMPDPKENEQLNDVEDIIVRELDGKVKGIFALVLTDGTMKEFVFYTAEGADIGAIHEAIQRGVSTHEVQCIAVEDPKWDTYAQFAAE